MRASEPELAEFRSLVAARLGLWFDDHRRDFLDGVLGERSVAQGGDPAAYLQLLAKPGSRHEWQVLAGLLTVTETYFLRGGDHFRALVDTALPERIRRQSGVRPLRLLSAGCASGEEAYSLAIFLRENSAALAGRAVEILGVDINPHALARARAGRYSEWALRETPPAVREKYFRPLRAELALDDAIVAAATFQERNLAEPNDDLWQPGGFDAVFCRNVLMYLVPETAVAIIGRIERALAPGGCLFLGHAETLRGLSQAFHLRRNQGAFYYQLRGEEELSQLAAAAAERASPPIAAKFVPADEPVGFSRMLVKHAGNQVDDKTRHYLDRICGATQRMGQLIDDMLALAQVTRTRLREEPTDLGALGQSIVTELRNGSPERAVEVVIAGGLMAYGDRGLLRILLENLLGNAWKFTSKCEAARIEFGRRPHGMEGDEAFFVRDNGAGFDMQYAGKLFGVFQRLHAMEDFPGTGVGLATVARVVRRHGGRAWAESPVGRGATFYFNLSPPTPPPP